ncbi:MAG TPA: PQQ-dependent sugar dehydrogenase [Anaerolineaceae bacterium]
MRTIYRYIVLCLILCLGFLPGTALKKTNSNLAAPPAYQISVSEVIASGLDHPVLVTHAGDGTNRLFVIEQPGRIRVIQGGTLLPAPFLDIRSLVSYGGERGLLGLAFHPGYSSNGYFYVNYTNSVGNTVVARYKVSSTNPSLADPASAQILFTVTQPYANHNGGHLAFGPDGYLYIALGDGGSAGDPQNNAQNLATPLGKILRIDVNNGSPYAIPATNPYATSSTADRRIWSWGLRNPWRFSFDRLTGDIYIGDVGQNAWEEVDFQLSGTSGGINYGWRCLEGNHTYNTQPPCNNSAYLNTLTGAVSEYPRPEGYSITGGYVYRGTQFPRLSGIYFFSDFVTGAIWSIKLNSRNPVSWSARTLETNAGFNISSFGEDQNGELYVCDYNGGTIRRLTDTVPSLALSSKHVSPSNANPGEKVTYTISLVNSGATSTGMLHLEDSIPTGLVYVAGSFNATSGSANASTAPKLTWDGTIAANSSVLLSYQATVQADYQGSVVNQSVITGATIPPLTLTASLSIPKPVLECTRADFTLPGTQPASLTNTLVDSADCDICHSPAIYDTWRGSMMGNAGRDPLFYPALSAANAFVPNSGEFCLRCHAPMGWYEGRSASPDGSSLSPQDLRNGISCSVCHRTISRIASTQDEAVAIDAAVRAGIIPLPPAYHASSGMLIVDPQDRRRGPFTLAADPARHPALRTDLFGQTGSIEEAQLCGTCHNIDNPALSWDPAQGEYLPNPLNAPAPSVEKGALFPIERTFDEWRNSAYAQGGVYAPQFAGAKADGVVRTCQDCHLPRATGYAADFPNPIFRDCQATGCLPVHDLVGANTWIPGLLSLSNWRLNAASESAYLVQNIERTRQFLRKAASLQITLISNAGNKSAQVTVYNQTGHKLPTGYTEGRRMWLEVRAFDANNNLVFSSGSYDPSTGTFTNPGDPYLKLYEAKQGISPNLAASLKAQNPALQLEAGPSFHFVLNNTIYKDNRIPPRGFTNAAYNAPGMQPVGVTYNDGQYWDTTTYPLPSNTERLLVYLYYQTASKEYIDFLKQFGGVDGLTLQALWNNSKSPPELIAVAFTPSFDNYLPELSKFR